MCSSDTKQTRKILIKIKVLYNSHQLKVAQLIPVWNTAQRMKDLTKSSHGWITTLQNLATCPSQPALQHRLVSEMAQATNRHRRSLRRHSCHGNHCRWCHCWSWNCWCLLGWRRSAWSKRDMEAGKVSGVRWFWSWKEKLGRREDWRWERGLGKKMKGLGLFLLSSHVGGEEDKWGGRRRSKLFRWMLGLLSETSWKMLDTWYSHT